MDKPVPEKVTRAYIVFNPVAGTQSPEVTRKLFEARFTEINWEYELYETTGKESVPDITRDAVKQGFDVLIAAGGDGTVGGVAAGVAGTNVPMGILPAGTGNAMARELSIPLDFSSALALITGPHDTRLIDGMKIGQDLYLLNVGVGISARSIRNTGRAQKRRFGNLAYAWNILQELSGFYVRPIDLKVDGRDQRVIASEILVLNSGILGVQKLPEGLQVCPDDGKVEIYIVRAQSALDMVSVVWSLMVNQREDHPKLQTISAEKSISINARRRMVVQADGEVVGNTPVSVQIIPNAVRIITPSPPEAQQTG
jgi:YegS/Rv2252/BmrU family lipid kinase